MAHELNISQSDLDELGPVASDMIGLKYQQTPYPTQQMLENAAQQRDDPVEQPAFYNSPKITAQKEVEEAEEFEEDKRSEQSQSQHTHSERSQQN